MHTLILLSGRFKWQHGVRHATDVSHIAHLCLYTLGPFKNGGFKKIQTARNFLGPQWLIFILSTRSHTISFSWTITRGKRNRNGGNKVLKRTTKNMKNHKEMFISEMDDNGSVMTRSRGRWWHTIRPDDIPEHFLDGYHHGRVSRAGNERETKKRAPAFYQCCR